MRAIAVLSAVSSLCLASGRASAQMHDHGAAVSPGIDPGVQRLVDRAKLATERFADRRVAIASGYRLVGRDLPQMGEHWLNPGLLINGGFDIDRPQVLMYLNVDGHPTLTGVVYAVPLEPGQSPPADFGPLAMWHEHNGTVDEEALLAQHHSTPSAATGTRVAFLHVWTRIPASETIFGADNWAIPFVRSGVSVPAAFPNGAARAVSLATGGSEFFSDLIGATAAGLVAQSFDDCARTSKAIVERARADRRGLTADELDVLDKSWRHLLSDVERQAGAAAGRAINGGEL